MRMRIASSGRMVANPEIAPILSGNLDERGRVARSMARMEDLGEGGVSAAGGVPGGPVVGMAVARVSHQGQAGGCEGLRDGLAGGEAFVEAVHYRQCGTGIDLPAGGDDIGDTHGGERTDDVAHAVV